MTIYGKEVDFKISRLKCATAMEAALKEMDETEQKAKKLGKESLTKVIGHIISMFRQFFITATGVDVLADCDDMEEAQAAYFQFLEDIKGQKATLMAPYSPDSIE